MDADDRRLPAFSLADSLFAALAAGLAFLLYLRTLAPGLLGGDSGELQFAAWLGGAAHPTGYPLYLMLGWLWTHLLPLRDPAWRMNVFSALWGGAAAGLVYLLAARVLAQRSDPEIGRGRAQTSADRDRLSPASAARNPEPNAKTQRRKRVFPGVQLPAFFAALTFAVTPTFWSQATVAEVYTLNATFVAAIFLAVVTWGQTGSRRALYAAALLIGLSLAHHRTTLLYLPAILAYIWLVSRGGPGTRGRRTVPSLRLTATLLVCLPLLLYLYLPLRAPRTFYNAMQILPDQVIQFYRPTWSGFIEHISGQGFSSALGAGATAAARLAGLPARFTGELTAVGVGLGLLGLAWLARRRRPLLALTGLSWLAVVGFNLLYGIGDIYVYYIPAYLIWTLWMAAGVWACSNGIAWLLEQKNSGFAARERGSLVSLFPCLLAFLLPACLLTTHFSPLDRSGDPTAQAWAALLARPIPQNAILVTNDRDEMVPQWYLKYVEGARADLTGLFPLLQPGPAWADVGTVTDQALRTGRPVYLIKPMAGLEVKYNLTPQDGLVRVIGPAAADSPERLAGQVFGDAIRLTGYDLMPAGLGAGGASGAAEIVLHWQPLVRLSGDYTTFVHLVNANGDKIAQSDHRPGGVYYPTSLWKPGEMLIDRHLLALPADLGPAPYTIVVGLYTGTTDLRGLGQPAEVGGW